MTDVTQILSQIESGDPSAADQLLPLVYEELRRLAAAKLANEKPGQTLQATALVHEAYLRLLGPGGADKPWNSRGHFFAAAAEAMRRILVENARRKKSVKAGGGMKRVGLEHMPGIFDAAPDDLLALDEAMTKLEGDDAQAAAVAKLHLFSGLTIDQTATSLGVHRATAFRHWAYARAFLQLQLPDSKCD
jgi:RNA polymerase sigma factor (TIGR02999 family)